MNKIFPLAALSLVLLASCNKENSLQNIRNVSQDGDLRYVTVDINVSTGGLVPMTESSTKAIDDPATTSDTAIKNLWVLQYDGVGDAAKLIGLPIYIGNYDDPAGRSAKLIASTSPNTIVFLANTFDKNLPFQQNSTIAELKQRVFTTRSLGTILTIDPNTADVGGGSFPTNGDYYQRLNGYVETVITEGSTLSCSLGHNACRVSVNVTNNTAGTTYPVTLVSADIVNVPGCMYFFTDYEGYTSGTKVGKPTAADLSTYDLIDYPDVITWSAAEGTSPATKSAKLYISANESGVVSANDNPKLKSLFSPSRATALVIKGTYKDGAEDIPVKYTFALGEDMVTNYQLVPNGDYVYDITLKARGDKTSDPRVYYASSTNGIDYTTTEWPLSNCYICNPPASETGSAVYKIPVARVDQFWGGGNYENVPNNCLAQNNAWTVSVIWSDFEVRPDNFAITKSTGTGKDDWFEVSVPGTSEMGNVVIGIKNAFSDDWLWSWHLWVTDYCPDEARFLTQQGAFLPGTDTYHVTGGDVQRYQVAAAGKVQKVFMDRSIGAMSTDYVGSGKGMLYYQFGRKDPFPGDAAYWENGTQMKLDGFVTAAKKVAYNATDANQPHNVPYSVKNPTKFITGYYWTYNDKFNPDPVVPQIIWQDPNFSNNGGKSIFDPSPSGWKVPTTFSGLSKNITIGGKYKANSSLIPGGGTIELPIPGTRQYSSGNLNGVGQSCCYRLSVPDNLKYGYSMFLNINGTINIQYSGTYDVGARGNGELVRPVQE